MIDLKEYQGSPHFKPDFGDDEDAQAREYLRLAIRTVRPHAREGVDFALVRENPWSPLEIRDWNAELLGKPPEIEQLCHEIVEDSQRRVGDSPAMGVYNVPLGVTSATPYIALYHTVVPSTGTTLPPAEPAPAPST